MDLEEKIIEYLEQCDLSRNDATVYLYLFKQGQSGPSEISGGTGIQRARVYDSLKRLIERGFIVQEIEKKRPQYTVTSPRILLSELEDEITRKKNALDEIKKNLIDRPPIPPLKGVYFYNTDASLRLKLQEIMETSVRKITIMAIIPDNILDEDLLPFKLLSKKKVLGQKILLILNIHSKNWEFCTDLFSENVRLYHFPYLKKLPALIHIIDDYALVISIYDQQNNHLVLRHGILIFGEKEITNVFDFIIEGFIEKSISFEKRLEELKKSIIYPTDKLKKIFGVNE